MPAPIPAGFEKWGKRTAPRGEPLAVTLTARGNFSLNRAAYAALGMPAYMVLYYEIDGKYLMLAASDKSDPDAVRAKPQPTGNHVTVPGVRFCTHFEIAHEIARSYPASRVPDSFAPMILVELNGPSTVIVGARHPSRARRQAADALAK